VSGFPFNVNIPPFYNAPLHLFGPILRHPGHTYSGIFASHITLLKN
jgi:hypothetical protein